MIRTDRLVIKKLKDRRNPQVIGDEVIPPPHFSSARSIRRCRAGFRSIFWCRFAGNKAIFLAQLNALPRSCLSQGVWSVVA
jgi:hypothetical protein